jgi:hypothetical protein
MRGLARRSRYDSYDDRDSYDADDDFYPGERIGRPLGGSGGKALFRGLIILIAAGGVWAAASDPTALRALWDKWVPFDFATLMASFDRKAPGPAENASPLPGTRFAPADLGTPRRTAAGEPLPPPPLAPITSTNSVAPLTTGSLPPAAARTEALASEPLPPPVADPSNPYQKKALAAGLHPDLSRVLLERLTAADYQNAAHAIKTAMFETADDAVFVWPRQRRPEQALFKVHFVAGAASGCRRYVVSVTKDGWLTTAPPMEKCGSEAGRARSKG